MNFTDRYELVVGLEIHVQLSTKSKLFSGDTNSYNACPNENVGVITAAHPGTLPRLNKNVIEQAVRVGIVFNCEIASEFSFDRKNYFYPDLPKGYQLTQDQNPICKNGSILIRKNGIEKSVGLFKIHLEEDAGKSIHSHDPHCSSVDFNRAGIPLIEIVTKPEIYSSEDAVKVLAEVRRTVRYLAVSDGDMEKGSIRCDANISVRPKGQKKLGKKVEIKNMNSLKNVSRAIDFEWHRQTKRLENGFHIVSETRTFDAEKGVTYGMRTKEELNDYRYFPDPDLSFITIDNGQLDKILKSIKVTPQKAYKCLVDDYSLPPNHAEVIVESPSLAEYSLRLLSKSGNRRSTGNWIIGPVKSYLNSKGININQFPIPDDKLLELIDLVDKGKVSYTAASQQVFKYLIQYSDEDVVQVIKKLDLMQEGDEDLMRTMVEELLYEMPEKVKSYKNGKKGLLGMFMGRLMKKNNGKLDPKKVNKLLQESLEKFKIT